MDDSNKIEKDVYRPYLHFTPRKGWINDPNGLIFANGGYRLFAQHNPYDHTWGPMHWLSMRSKDLITFETDDEFALMPSEPYDDQFGCFSGSALEKDGNLYLMYTGATTDRQVQCLAIERNGGFVKIAENPIMDEKDLPDAYLIKDFRDPKVVFVDGTYYCFLATRKKEGGSSIVLFKSDDLISWSFVGSVLESEDFDGEMFECPDIIKIGGKDLLMFSIQGYSPDGINTVNKNNVLGCIGHMDFNNGKFIPLGRWRCIDDGFDFYATQTCHSENGKHLLISWMNAWGSKDYTGKEDGWCGRFTIPRMLSINEENRLIQRFSDELNKYEAPLFDDKKRPAIDEFGKSHRLSFMDARIEMTKDMVIGRSLKIRAGDEFVKLTFNDGLLELDRSNVENKISTETKADDYVRYSELDKDRSTISLRIVVDVSSIEIEIDDGYSMMALNFYPKDPRYGLDLEDIDDLAIKSCSIKTRK